MLIFEIPSGRLGLEIMSIYQRRTRWPYWCLFSCAVHQVASFALKHRIGWHATCDFPRVTDRRYLSACLDSRTAQLKSSCESWNASTVDQYVSLNVRFITVFDWSDGIVIVKLIAKNSNMLRLMMLKFTTHATPLPIAQVRSSRQSPILMREQH